MFPGQQVLFDYTHPGLIFKETGHHMQLDIYLPHLAVALEYQVRALWKLLVMNLLGQTTLSPTSAIWWTERAKGTRPREASCLSAYWYNSYPSALLVG
jgi:hypothetical protein